MATKRTGFDGTDSIADAIPHKPVARYACSAHQCPMPGTIFSGGSGGMCAYHIGTHGTDWPRITRVLLDWQCVTLEINAIRRAHCDMELSGHPDELAKRFADAWARMQPLVAGAWEEELKPGNLKSGHPETYRDWGMRLERFIGQRVVEVLRKRLGAKAA